jgi:hypothetical protein
MPRRLLGRLAALVALATTASLLTACAGADESPPLPDGLTVEVRQSRLDAADGILVVGFTNAGTEPVTIDGFEVRSPTLEPGMSYAEPFELGAGGDQLDIRIERTSSVCDAGADPADATVFVEATTADGPRDGELVPDDPFDTLTRLVDTDCLAGSVAEVAEIRMPEALRTEGTGLARRAYLDVLVEPVASARQDEDGAADITMHLGTVYGTTLINAEGGTDWSIDRDVAAGDAPFTITLAVKPARCDAHAIADDKRGTILPFEITTSDGRAGRLDRPAGDRLKSELYAYYDERCGL